jgi:hypothetical protein
MIRNRKSEDPFISKYLLKVDVPIPEENHDKSSYDKDDPDEDIGE